MRAYPYIIGFILIILLLALAMLIGRMKDLEDWEKDHKYETHMTYLETGVR